MYPATGRSDDILMLLARAEELRMRGEIPVKTPIKRALTELPFNILGAAVNAALWLLPAETVAKLQDKVFLSLAGGKPTFPFVEDSAGLRAAEELLAAASRAAGRPAAILCLTSHPPAIGELLYLTIEMMRHALWAMYRLRGAPCRPRILNAMDYFALDMLPLHEEGVYAGFMTFYHLGFDRLVHLRPCLSRMLLRRSAWPNVIWRLCRAMRDGREVSMVLGGGVPATSRLHYCAREFVLRLWRERPGKAAPREILARLASEAPEYARFLESGEVGADLGRSVRRGMEAWIISRLAEADGLGSVDAGKPTASALSALASCIRALGWDAGRVGGLIAEFEREFARETPFRERFLRVLAARVAARGTPVLFVPLTYGRPDAVCMTYSEPVCLMGAGGSPRGSTVKLLKPGGAGLELALRDFAREWGGRYI